ncbi:MAG TPA: peroxidase family protein [Streptosporangiaceae bacterium]
MNTSTEHAVHRIERDHCLGPSRTVDAPIGGARYGRMFADLPALITDVADLESAGKPGGACDATAALDVLAYGHDDAADAAGWPFFGQLIAHDITADRSPVGPEADVASLRNARSPKLNLETVYGDGPVGAPYLYDVGDPAKLLIGADGLDLPRNSQGVALIGDPRNDVHIVAAHLHLALLHAHNGLVALLSADGITGADLFDSAKRALTWHYQWIVVHDFLPRLVGTELADEVLAHRGRFFNPAPSDAYLPLEFADAAYRYGHGQIRHAYQLQPGGPEYPLFPDLASFGPITPEHRIDLGQLFDLPGHPPAQRAKAMDGGLPASLINLPHQVTGEVDVDAYRSLAVRDLLRGSATRLPSGEAVAQALGVAPLSRDEIGHSWASGTPLWFYILMEAHVRGGGDQLGPVGGRIVTEVLLGLLRADPCSYLTVRPSWSPTLPRHGGANFGLADLLLFAVDAQPRSSPGP